VLPPSPLPGTVRAPFHTTPLPGMHVAVGISRAKGLALLCNLIMQPHVARCHRTFRVPQGGVPLASLVPLSPWRYLPRSRVWGKPEERTGAGVCSPGYDLSPGITMTAPGGGGGGRRRDELGGVGCWHIESREAGKGRSRKARPLPSFCVIVGIPSHTSKSLKIR
jgi:hypothetical protein